jgi:hypothetical protein
MTDLIRPHYTQTFPPRSPTPQEIEMVLAYMKGPLAWTDAKEGDLPRIAILDHFISDGPGYAGPVFWLQWSGGPECHDICVLRGGALERAPRDGQTCADDLLRDALAVIEESEHKDEHRDLITKARAVLGPRWTPIIHVQPFASTEAERLEQDRPEWDEYTHGRDEPIADDTARITPEIRRDFDEGVKEDEWLSDWQPVPDHEIEASLDLLAFATTESGTYHLSRAQQRIYKLHDRRWYLLVPRPTVTSELAKYGFGHDETGGGCTAFTKGHSGFTTYITDANDPLAPEGLTDACLLGTYDDNTGNLIGPLLRFPTVTDLLAALKAGAK